MSRLPPDYKLHLEFENSKPKNLRHRFVYGKASLIRLKGFPLFAMAKVGIRNRGLAREHRYCSRDTPMTNPNRAETEQNQEGTFLYYLYFDASPFSSLSLKPCPAQPKSTSQKSSSTSSSRGINTGTYSTITKMESPSSTSLPLFLHASRRLLFIRLIPISAKVIIRCFPSALANFSRVENLMSSAWFSMRETAVS